MNKFVYVCVALTAVAAAAAFGYCWRDSKESAAVTVVERDQPIQIVERTVEKTVQSADSAREPAPAVKRTRIVRGTGFVRGRSTRTLKNKYAGYVSKVNFYSQQLVKKGDVILEYDDFDLRTEITELENDIAETQQALRQAKLDLALTRMDPLPSTYRNLRLKQQIAQERLKRHVHELEVYEQLFGSKIVSDLQLREKRQQVADYKGELLCLNSDMKILNQGLGKLLVQSSTEDVREIEIKLQSLQRKLELLREKRKYYKLVTPVDGLCITNSDTVGGYDSVGTAAAIVHIVDRKLVYAYFDERDIRHVVEGKTCRFISNQYGDSVTFEVVPYEVKRTFYSYGDRLMMYAKFRLTKEPKPLRIESIGTVEIEVTEQKLFSGAL